MFNKLLVKEVLVPTFVEYLRVGNSRSNKKLKQLHGGIARDLKEVLGDGYIIHSQGYGDDKEMVVNGLLYPKAVDITICDENDKPLAGIAVKFVQGNYSQNSVNYVENMLGETANLRAAGLPYFQIFCTFDKIPYFDRDGKFVRYDKMGKKQLDKYVNISKAPDGLLCIPDDTLLVVLRMNDNDIHFASKEEYIDGLFASFDALTFDYAPTEAEFGDRLSYNDYQRFVGKVVTAVVS